jgi:GDP-4-dehydro-6-deoxy-D-mannose reductase
MRVLILGASGSVGYYFLEYLNSIKFPMWDVYGIYRRAYDDSLIPVGNRIRLDLAGPGATHWITEGLESINPSVVFNFASDAVVDDAISNPSKVMVNNSALMSNFLQAMVNSHSKATLVHVSTAEVYGNADEIPTSESSPFKPVNPYAISKVVQERLCEFYAKVYGVKVITYRSSSYINPRRGDLVLSVFVDKCLAYIKQDINIVKMGNLESIRTWMDVRDIVGLYWDGLDFCNVGEAYNIGPLDSSICLSVREGCYDILDALQLPKRIMVSDRSRFRSLDIKKQLLDSSKFYEGYRSSLPLRIPFTDSLKWLIEEREKLNK